METVCDHHWHVLDTFTQGFWGGSERRQCCRCGRTNTVEFRMVVPEGCGQFAMPTVRDYGEVGPVKR